MRTCIGRLILAVFAAAAGGSADGSVVVENSRMTMTIGDDAVVRSLVVKATGEELISPDATLPFCTVTQDRLFNNEIKLAYPCRETTCRANRVRRSDDRLFVGFDLVDYEAEIALREGDGFVGFELIRFIAPNLGRYGGRPTDLDMDWPPVRRIRFVQLQVKDRMRFGDWLNVAWDDRAAVAVVAAEPFAAVGCKQRPNMRILTAEADASFGLEGRKAALIVSPTAEFLDDLSAFEAAYGLPRGVESRRSEAFNASVYWTNDVSPANLDNHIALAKQGGFRMMLIYHTAICDHPGDYLSIGSYAYRCEYPNGDEDVRVLLERIKAAGLRVGFHVLHPFAGLESSYVRPVADPRLNLKRHFTLSRPLDQGSTEIVVEENPAGSPRQNGKCRLLAFGGELLSYESYTTERPYRFTGVRRGAQGTMPVEHPRGQIGGVLDVCEFGGTACYVDQNSSLQDELAAKIARIYNLGFDFLCLDGCEGVNPPHAIHVANAQYRVWKLLDPKPLFTEGAAKAHFAWHHLSGANAFDVFPPEEFKAMIIKWPLHEAEMLAQDFSRISFGWWGFWLPGETLKDGRTTIGTQPDMWEFGTSRAAAWDSPTTIQFSPEKVSRHPRAKDLMETMRRWEDVRAKKWLTPAQKAALKDPTRQHHLFLNERGEYELQEVEMLVPETAIGLRAFLFERNGKRVIAYWHTSGSGDYSMPVGADGANVMLHASDLRYNETELSRDRVVNAFRRETGRTR